MVVESVVEADELGVGCFVDLPWGLVPVEEAREAVDFLPRVC